MFTSLNLLFLIAFILSAAVQYNDPDALPWIIIYLAAAFMCIARLRNLQFRWLPALLLTTSLIWIGMLLPSVIGQVSPAEVVESITMQTRAVEEAREIGGLVLVALWAGILLIKR